MGTSDFHAEATSPFIDAGRGDCDLISSALVIFSVKSAFVNITENRAFSHPRTPRDLGGPEVLLDCRERKDDVDQLSARFTSERAVNLFPTFSRQIHSDREESILERKKGGETYARFFRTWDVPLGASASRVRATASYVGAEGPG